MAKSDFAVILGQHWPGSACIDQYMFGIPLCDWLHMRSRARRQRNVLRIRNDFASWSCCDW